MAVEMADYGQCLAPMSHFRGDPPFEDSYADHAVYLRALLGQDVDHATAHFRKKVTETVAAPLDTTPAEVLIELLVRLRQYAEAVQASLEFFPNSSAIPLSCASAIQLCQMARDYRQLRDLARGRAICWRLPPQSSRAKVYFPRKGSNVCTSTIYENDAADNSLGQRLRGLADGTLVGPSSPPAHARPDSTQPGPSG